MAPDAHLELFYLSFSYKSNSMAVQFARFLKMLIRKVEEVKVRSELTDRNATSDKLSLDLVDALFTLAMAW